MPNIQEILQLLTSPFQRELVSPLASSKQVNRSTPQPTPTPQVLNQIVNAQSRKEMAQASSSEKEIERKIRAGFREYAKSQGVQGELPVEKYVPLLVEATKKYPVFKEQPFLLPQVSILETSGGRNITRPNNILNWGARLQKAGDYSPESYEQAIQDAITAIGGDMESRPPGTPRGRTASYYQGFRDNPQDLKNFSNTYEPTNPEYYQNLIKGIEVFKRQ